MSLYAQVSGTCKYYHFAILLEVEVADLPLGLLESVLRLFLGHCIIVESEALLICLLGTRLVCMQLLSIRDSKPANNEEGV